MMADDYAKWVKVIKSAGIKPRVTGAPSGGCDGATSDPLSTG